MVQKFESPNIVIVGGGTGTSTLLREAKYATPNITAIVNVFDDGGSTGQLVAERGVTPAGDIRQCLGALSTNEALAELFNQRLENGHTVGNLRLADLEEDLGCFIEACDTAGTELSSVGRVLPVTTDRASLAMSFSDGSTILGESNIGDAFIQGKNPRLHFDITPNLHEQAEDAIMSADVVVIAPGNPYRSRLPVLAVRGMDFAMRRTDAHKVMIGNLVNLPGHTSGWHNSDHTDTVTERIGDIHTLVYNETYIAAQNDPVGTSIEGFKRLRAECVGRPLLAEALKSIDPNDPIASKRNTFLHDATVTVDTIMELAGHPSYDSRQLATA